MNTKNEKEYVLKHWQVVALFVMGYDVVTIAASYIIAALLRFDFKYSVMMHQYGRQLFTFLPFYVAGCLLIYWALKLYKSVWRFSSFWELERIFAATLLCFLLSLAISLGFTGRLPISVYCMGIILQVCFTCALRFFYRFVLLLRENVLSKKQEKKNALIIGAGLAGQMILRDARRESSDLKVCAIIDDNVNKHSRFIDGVIVYGGRDKIEEAVKGYNIDTILFAIPSASAQDKKEILDICQKTGCKTKVLPSLVQLANSEMNIRNMHDIKMEDLLGRDPIKVDLEGILASLAGKVILVTGGGGSIGSELCRQIASHAPKQLLILDFYENNAYEIQNELKRRYPDLNLKVIIASVRDSRRVNEVFETYHPQIVYHAAAHKHVPLMEVSPCEAIKNNVFGTYKVAKAALEHGTERFVLISTDKAVHPTNIMGASKRLCEMVVQTLNDVSSRRIQTTLPNIGLNYALHEDGRTPKPGTTQFVAVRFGNVLGSNGSVIPLFEKQIAAGGPVTVTHKEITRFFMTIPEAVSLVLQAGTYAKGGEIFVLDMGEPVKIDKLARQLIRLRGYIPDKDIKVEYTGLRPGEKLYEEKLMAEEGLEKTPNDLIHIGKPLDFDREKFLDQLQDFYRCAMNNEEAEIVLFTRALVKTYTPDFESFKYNGIHFEDVLEKYSSKKPV